MKDIKTRLLILLTLLCTLPILAQKPTRVTVRTSKDSPFMLRDVNCVYYDYTASTSKGGGMKREKGVFCAEHDIQLITRMDISCTVLTSDGGVIGIHGYGVPVVPGYDMELAIDDIYNYEVGGNPLYTEYDKALKAIYGQGKDVGTYIKAHRREKGCALFVFSLIENVRRLEVRDSLHALFAPAVQQFLPKEELTVRHWEMQSSDPGYYLWRNLVDHEKPHVNVRQISRSLEGKEFLDSLKAPYAGKPTLICVYGGYRAKPAAVLYQARNLNTVYLPDPSLDDYNTERYWKQEKWVHPGDHYFVMAYQADYLRQAYMPGSKEFFLLLDAKGRVVARGDQNGYEDLLVAMSHLKKEAGIQDVKPQPYNPTYLDLDVAADTPWQKLTDEQRDIVEQATTRMRVTKTYKVGQNTYSGFYGLGDMEPKELRISPRLYAYAKVRLLDREQQNLRQIEGREGILASRDPDYDPATAMADKEIAVGQAVDLGLSILWADMNVGAGKPEDPGIYFNWGDVREAKGAQGWHTYRWCKDASTTLTKYNNNPELGAVDNRSVLEAKDDAASVCWGAAWRMPTKEEAEELVEKCTWTWCKQEGMNGYKVTGPNGNSIFIPASGCLNWQGTYGVNEHGYFWTSSLDPENPTYAFYAGLHPGVSEIGKMERFAGRPVRPVTGAAKRN